MTDSFQFKCPFCEQEMEVPAEAQGQVGNCPSCNEEIVPNEEKIVFDEEIAKDIPQNKNTKTCPFCAELILTAAIKCKHCGSDQEKELATNKSKEKSDEMEISHGSPSWLYFVPGCLAGLFIILMFSFISVFSTPSYAPEEDISIAPFFGMFFFWAFILALIVLWRKYSHKFKLTSRRIIIINGIIVKNEDEVRLRDIRSIALRRGLFNVFTGTASVKIATAATAGSEIVIKNIANAKKLQAQLNSLVHDMEN